MNLHQPKRVRLSSEHSDSSEGSETKIYAISSEGGNVIYHVSNTVPGQTPKPFTGKASEELCSYALTSVTKAGSATEMTHTRGETELSFEKVNPSHLNLRVNPFGSQSSLDKAAGDFTDTCSIFVNNAGSAKYPQNLLNAKRLDSETCKKEGLFFDENEPLDNEEHETIEVGATADETDQFDGKSKDVEVQTIEEVPDVESDSEDIVANILYDLIDRAVDRDNDGSVDTETVSSVFEETSEGYANASVGTGSRRLTERSMSLQSRESGSVMGVDDLLNAIDSKISEADSQSENEDDTRSEHVHRRDEEIPVIHPLHTHILLYSQKYDAQRTLHALSCVKAILTTTPRLVACAMATTNVSSSLTPHLQYLQHLLTRHRRAVFGKNFFSEMPPDAGASFRSSMFVEIVISVCLYFIRSYYPNLILSKLTEQELQGNKDVQILSCEVLTLLLSELVNVAKDSGKGFSTYISDLLTRCKVQKALLHCILASVYNARRKSNTADYANLTEAIINFNEENMDTHTQEAYQVKLLKILLVLVILEDQIKKSKSDPESMLPSEWEKSRVNFQPSLSSVRYVHGRPVVYQVMLLSAVLSALKQMHLCHMHRHWIAMVTSALPYMGRALSHMVVSVVNQLCHNLESLSKLLENGHTQNG